MHELALAQQIVDIACDALAGHADARVEKLRLRIGAMHQVVVEALTLGFAATAQQTPLQDAELDIEHVDVAVRCKACATEFTVEDFTFVCPACGGVDVEILRGNEFDVVSLELEEAAEHSGTE